MRVASLRARIGGYVVDMVIFAAVAMLLLVAAGFLLLVLTDFVQDDATDPEMYSALSVIGIGLPIAWSALNLLLLSTRSQTGGQYVAGLRMLREDGSRLRFRDAAVWWFTFNPLLFSWPMALISTLPMVAVVALALSRASVGFFVAILVVCAAAPLIALVSALIDGQNRALHDRIANVVAMPAD